MRLVSLFRHRTFYSSADGSAQSTTLEAPIDVLGAKSLAVNWVVEGVSTTDTRISVTDQPGVDGRTWESTAGVLIDSGSSTGVAVGAGSSSSTTEVTRWAFVLPSIKVEKISGGAGTLKSVTVSAWAVLKPF